MAIIADILLAAGALGAAFYCWVLGRRLKKFNNLENGMGGAVAVLSAQVDDLEKTLSSAQLSARSSADELTALVQRSEDVRRHLELQIAALHDVVPPSGELSENASPMKSTSTPQAQGVAQRPNPPEAEPMFTRRRVG